MKLQLKINPENGVIEDAKFKTFGCGSAIASSSYVTELVKGKHIEEAMTIKNTVIVKELNLLPVTIHYSVLDDDAISFTDARRNARIWSSPEISIPSVRSPSAGRTQRCRENCRTRPANLRF
jgi:nitrogen fixation NifU-like protein